MITSCVFLATAAGVRTLYVYEHSNITFLSRRLSSLVISTEAEITGGILARAADRGKYWPTVRPCVVHKLEIQYVCCPDFVHKLEIQYVHTENGVVIVTKIF